METFTFQMLYIYDAPLSLRHWRSGIVQAAGQRQRPTCWRNLGRAQPRYGGRQGPSVNSVAFDDVDTASRPVGRSISRSVDDIVADDESVTEVDSDMA